LAWEVDGLARVILVTKSVFTTKYDRFRQLLVDARQQANLTQARLALKLSRHQSFVSKYERGERRLDVVEFLEIAKAIGIDAIAFIRKIDDD
jgi:transcriptional regulator with XRE-family HTH domain